MGIFYKNEGAITVFLSLILMPMLILSGIAVDFMRIYGAKAILTDSAYLAANTALASYDKVLKDVYGILAISADENELSNNLIEYFEATINSCGLDFDEEDSYIKAIIEDIKNSVNLQDGVNFNNLIDMETTSFLASGIQGSEVYEPQIIKKQIIDFMKYRGAISIGSNLLEKISVFKELPKQQEVIEARVDYEIELNKVQEACKEAYMAVSSYGEMYTRLGNYTIEDFNKASNYGTDSYKGIADINKLLLTLYLNKALINSSSQIKVSINDLSYSYIYSHLSSCIASSIVDDIKFPTADCSADNLIKYYYYIHMNAYEISELAEYYSVLDDKYREYRQSIMLHYSDYESAQEALKIAENEYFLLVNGIRSTADKAKKLLEDLYNRKNDIENLIQENFTRLNADLNTKYDLVIGMKEQTQIAGEKLNSIITDIIPMVNEKRDFWIEKIDELSDGNFKDSLRQQYSDIIGNLNQQDIEKMIKIIDKNHQYYSKLSACLEKVDYNDIFYISSDVDYSTDALAKGSSFNSYNYDFSLKEANRIFSDLHSSINASEMSGFSSKSFKNDKFYQYLAKSFKYINNDDAKAYEHEAKENKKTLLDTVNTAVNVGNEHMESEISNKVPASGDIYEDLATTILQNKSNDGIESVVGIDSNADMDMLEKSAKNQTSFMKNSVQVIDALVNSAQDLSAGLKDNLYMVEYLTEMFSCHTSYLNDEKTLSGIEITADNNFLYGREIEYLLWGKNGEETGKNNTYTSTGIFGLRFVLNTLYAYTDAEIKAFTLSTAVALAGFTGFGIPIVQNALILALAMGESALDLSKLLNGHSVVIYKSYTTWTLKPSGLGREIITETVQSVAEKAVEKLSDKVVELAENYCDDNIRALENAFDEYTQSLADNLAMEVSNLVLTPIQSQIAVLFETGATGINNFNSLIDSSYAAVREHIFNEPDSFIRTVKLLMTDIFISTKLNEIKAEINSLYSSFCDEAGLFKEKLEGKIIGYITDTANELKSIIIENGYEKLKKEAKKSFYGLTGDVKEEINNIIGDFTNKVSIGFTAPKNFTAGSSANKLNPMAGITMTYKEYLKVFIFSGLIAGKENEYMIRVCDLIKLNLVCSNSSPMPEFMLANSYTGIKIDAKVSVRTTFMRYKLFKEPWEENCCYLNYSVTNKY